MDASGQHELRRSHKVQDFVGSGGGGGGGGGVTRERSFIRQHGQARADEHHQQQAKRRSQIMNQPKGKPAMEIYRPPNVRLDAMPLNVHAKEFTMRSSNLQQSRSSGNILVSTPRVQFTLPGPAVLKSPSGLLHPQQQQQQQQLLLQQQQQQQQQLMKKKVAGAAPGAAIKRSKSMSAADSAALSAKLRGLTTVDASSLGQLPGDAALDLKQALADPNRLGSRQLMELARHVLERIVESRAFSEPGAKICIAIIERERTETFLESLLNLCQQWFQERDAVLRRPAVGAEGSRFTAFMWFLTEMCIQLRRRERQQIAGVAAVQLLNLLAKCCRACVEPPAVHQHEIECLYFVLNAIGRNLESDTPQQMEQLLSDVRNGFLASSASPNVRKTLLQLIELKASNWQLSGPTVLYYYPKLK